MKNCFSPVLYKVRNVIERMFCRIKDFRRTARRYHRKAQNFLSALCLVVVICYWL
ncbi:transposase [Pseudovibrio axinellae]|uniref:transposase n=1 Tax=Pseudovibrio axinellae TaxID=989403 RepID=UPI0009EDFFDC